ncbi:hypothetical protein PoB_000846100 [Plakobranchus ocellatus]|uniref:Uncharacterized protein n=1 Tax=Plakobranchus ocellatus TaxID=259542 RepID=A0AAV3YHV5_9GAST|nr:hypothetical protein PoB_000846100 [Plakobranchus ocellatus]
MYKLVSGEVGAVSGAHDGTGSGVRSVGTQYFFERSLATLSMDTFLILRCCCAKSSTISFSGAPSPLRRYLSWARTVCSPLLSSSGSHPAASSRIAIGVLLQTRRCRRANAILCSHLLVVRPR